MIRIKKIKKIKKIKFHSLLSLLIHLNNSKHSAIPNYASIIQSIANLDIVMIRLMLSDFCLTKVITLSGFQCTYLALFDVL